jgi:hypothetical protein
MVKLSPPKLVTRCALPRAQNSLPAFSGKPSLLLSLMLKVEQKPQLR